MYPVLASISSDVPVTSTHTNPPPLEDIVIELLAFTIETPTPAVNVEADGTPAVDPIITCPSVASAVMTGIPVAPVVNTPLFAVANPETTSVADEYRICDTVVVDGYVAVENKGSAEEPADCRGTALQHNLARTR